MERGEEGDGTVSGIHQELQTRRRYVLATTNPLTNLFGRNPFTSLQQHMRAVMQCVDEVPGLFEAVAVKDRDRMVEIKDRIFEREDEADQIKNQLREQLPRGLFLPVNRGDLLEILDMQDSIADVAQDIAGLLYERSMEIPDPMVTSVKAYVDRCVAVCHEASDIIGQLDELLEMGFRGREVNHVEKMISKLNESESETDAMGMELSRLLFQHERDMYPVTVIFWYQLIEWIGDLADYAEKVGNRLRLVIAR